MLPIGVIVIVTLCTLFVSTTAEPAHPIIKQENGIIFIHGKNVLIKKGTYHAKIFTSINRREKLKETLKMRSSFLDLCNLASKAQDFDLQCNSESYEMDHLIKKLDQTTHFRQKRSAVQGNKRTKRGSKGIIPMLWSCLVELLTGSNSPDPETVSATLAGVIIHQTKAVRNIEGQLTRKEQHVENSLTKLTTAIKKRREDLAWRLSPVTDQTSTFIV